MIYLSSLDFSDVAMALGDAIQMKSEHQELLFKYAWQVHKLVHEHVMGGALVSKEALC